MPAADAEKLKADKGWAFKQDGDKWRRVVASPLPKHVFEVRPIKWLLEKGTIIIAAGGGGIPTVYEPGRQLRGIEAVIDKDLCSELLARQLEADVFIMATDADAVFTDWGKPTARAFRRASPEAMRGSVSQPARWDRRSMLPATSLKRPASAPRSAP
jgi:carbamate kinase